MAVKTVVVTISAGLVASDLDAYPVHIDLASFGAEFWDFVRSDGGDLRARALSGQIRYPIDVVSINKGNQTGHIFVRVPVLAAGNQFRIDFGDANEQMPDANNPLIGRYAVWKDFGPVFTGFSDDLYRRRFTSWNKYPGLDRNGNFIHATGGFLRAGRGDEPDLPYRSFSWIGKRTGGSGDGAIMSINGETQWQVPINNGTAFFSPERETLYMRENGKIGLYNTEGDEWLQGGAWSSGELMQVGFYHAGVLYRSIFQNGAIIATENDVQLVPTEGNYKYFAAESNSAVTPLTCKFHLAYMYRGILSDDWIAFEYANWFNPSTTIAFEIVDLQEYLDMSILYAGTSMADFAYFGSVAASALTTRKDMYVSESIELSASDDLVANIGAVSDFWVCFYFYGLANPNTDNAFIRFYNTGYSTANALLRLNMFDGNGNLSYWNGSEYVNDNAFSDALMFAESVVRVDLHIVLSDTAGKFDVYINGEFDAGLSFVDTILTTATDIDRVSFRGASVFDTVYYSGIIISDEDTRGMRLVQRLPTLAGSQVDWTGDVSAVDEVGVNDADAITSATTDQVELFNFDDLPTEFASSPIAAVVLSARAQSSAVSPTTIDGVTRINGVNYDQSPQREIPTAYAPAQFIFPTNPETLSEWTTADVNAAEFGVKSKA